MRAVTDLSALGWTPDRAAELPAGLRARAGVPRRPRPAERADRRRREPRPPRRGALRRVRPGRPGGGRLGRAARRARRRRPAPDAAPSCAPSPAGRRRRRWWRPTWTSSWSSTRSSGEARLRRVERYLAVAWSSGATPVVVLTKADLCDDVAGRGRAGRRGRPGRRGAGRSARSPARAWTPSARCSAPGRTGAMVGPSGVGKSSLANALAGRHARRRPARSGRATAAAGTRRPRASCTCCPAAGCSSTPPACASSALYDDAEGVDTAYADVAALAADCRFRDCGHRTEPGCAVAAAIDDGPAGPRPVQRLAQAAGRGAPPAAAGRRPRPGRGEGAAAVLPPGDPGAAQPAALTVRPVDSASVRVLVIGSGAREHALCVALSSDPAVSALACAPGNAGTRAVAEPLAVDAADPDAVAARRRRRGAPTSSSSAPRCRWSPAPPTPSGTPASPASARRREAAQLEGSKSFAKHVMAAAGRADRPLVAGRRAGGAGDRAGRGRGRARTWSRTTGWPPARACSSPTTAPPPSPTASAVLDAGRRGARRGVPRRPRGVAVRRHRRDDGACRWCPRRTSSAGTTATAGPNTGGMGAYAPLPWAPPGLVDEVLATVLQPTVDEMARRGETFSGLLYAGPGAHLARRAGGGVQRPLRRPGDPGRAAAAGDAAGRAAARRRDRHARRPPAAALARRRRGDRRRRRARAIRRRRAPASRSPGPTARACCTPAPRWPPTARWSPPAGRVLAVTAVGRRPRRRPAGRLRAGGRRAAGRRALAHRHRAGRRRGPDQPSPGVSAASAGRPTAGRARSGRGSGGRGPSCRRLR